MTVSTYNMLLGFILFSFWTCISSAKEKTLSIPLQSTVQQERYPGVFLDDSTSLTITCDPSQVVEVEKVDIFEIDINKSKISYGTEYKKTFEAVNQNGNVILCLGKSKKTGEMMSGKIRLLTTLDAAYYNDASKWGICEDEYCLNRGRCYKDLESGLAKFCVCVNHFVGSNCQETGGSKNGPTNLIQLPRVIEGVSPLIFAIVVFVIAGIALIFLGSTVRYYQKHEYERRLRRGYICHQCNLRVCHQHIDDQTQTSGRDLNSQKTNQEYAKLDQIDDL